MATLNTLKSYSIELLTRRALNLDIVDAEDMNKSELVQAIFDREQHNALVAPGNTPDTHQEVMDRAENGEMESDEALEYGVTEVPVELEKPTRKAGKVSSMKSVRNIVRKLVDQAIAKRNTPFFALMVNTGTVAFQVWVRVECDDEMKMSFSMGPEEGTIVTSETSQEKAYRVLGSTLGFEETTATAELTGDEE